MNLKSLLLIMCLVIVGGCSSDGSPPSGKDSMSEYMKEAPKSAPSDPAKGEGAAEGSPKGVRGR